MIMRLGRYATAMTLAIAMTSICGSVHAQLISDTVKGDDRICQYFGSDILPNDQVVSRSLTIGLGQSCPATAPYVDPNAPPPSNARLTGQTTGGSGRVCVYEQAGIDYQITVPVSINCAMTPALLDRALAGTP